MKILLVCGGGASSGFLCQKMRLYAKTVDSNSFVDAIGETELEDYLEDTSVVLIGPHLKYMEEELSELIKEYNVPYAFIPDTFYSTLNGEETMKYALNIIKERGI